MSPGGLPSTVLPAADPRAEALLAEAERRDPDGRRRRRRGRRRLPPGTSPPGQRWGTPAPTRSGATPPTGSAICGLGALRANGWRGSGYVRWAEPTNVGFLRCSACSGRRRRSASTTKRRAASSSCSSSIPPGRHPDGRVAAHGRRRVVRQREQADGARQGLDRGRRESMVEHVCTVLDAAGCAPVVLVGGDRSRLTAATGREVLADTWPGEGPLGGVIDAVRWFAGGGVGGRRRRMRPVRPDRRGGARRRRRPQRSSPSPGAGIRASPAGRSERSASSRRCSASACARCTRRSKPSAPATSPSTRRRCATSTAQPISPDPISTGNLVQMRTAIPVETGKGGHHAWMRWDGATAVITGACGGSAVRSPPRLVERRAGRADRPLRRVGGVARPSRRPRRGLDRRRRPHRRQSARASDRRARRRARRHRRARQQRRHRQLGPVRRHARRRTRPVLALNLVAAMRMTTGPARHDPAPPRPSSTSARWPAASAPRSRRSTRHVEVRPDRLHRSARRRAPARHRRVDGQSRTGRHRVHEQRDGTSGRAVAAPAPPARVAAAVISIVEEGRLERVVLLAAPRPRPAHDRAGHVHLGGAAGGRRSARRVRAPLDLRPGRLKPGDADDPGPDVGTHRRAARAPAAMPSAR